MIFNFYKDIKFTNYFKKMNFFSFLLIIFSISTILLKGLNLGVDFKGGTLIEVRVDNPAINISEIRQSLLKMNLGDVVVKKFGKDNDFLVNIELSKSNNNKNFIETVKKKTFIRSWNRG